MRSRPLTITAIAGVVATVAVLAGCNSGCKGPDCAKSAVAQEADTLKRIKQTGTIVLGHRGSSVPFSYYNDDDKEVIGYSYDLAMKIVDAVKKELQMPDLKVKLVPISPENRWTMIQNGRIDLECGTTGHTLEREQYAAFSNSIFIVKMRILTRKDYGINDFADLVGKTVVTTAGTTNVDSVRKMNDERQMGMNVIIAKDHREAFLTLETGGAAAFLMDDVLLYGERARAIRWGDWIVTGTPQSREAYACIMRKNDASFKKVVDQALAAEMTSADFTNLYDKWFLSPIPPKGIKLDLPLSEDMKELIKAPNDKPFQ